MKKLIMLFTLLIITTSTICFGYEVDDSRWIWLVSTDSQSIYYDSKTYRYYKEGNYYTHGDFWILWSEPFNGKHSIQHIDFDYSRKSFKIIESIKYDADGRVVDSYKPPYPTYNTMIPGSIGEEIMDKTRPVHR